MASGPTEATLTGNELRFAPLPSIGPKQSVTWKVVVRCDTPGDQRFTISVMSNEHPKPVEDVESTTIY